MVEKVNPTFEVNLPRSFAGKTITQLNIVFGVDTSNSLQPDGAVDQALKTITLRTTILMHSAITNSGQNLTVYVEGEFAGEAVALQTDIRALGTVDSVNLSNATVTEGIVFQSEQTNP